MRVNLSLFGGHTSLSNEFIDNYMTAANPTFAVIYIYFFRYCQSGQCNITTKDAADAFGILESDVVNCFKFWEKQGLLSLADDDGDFRIEFLPVSEKKSRASSAVIPLSELKPELKPEVKPELKPVLIESRPIYSVEELEIYQAESDEVRTLFAMAEKHLGQLFKYDELNIIFGIYDWLRLPMPVIERLLEYCAGNRHTNLRYIEKVAIDWSERGITTVELADEQILMHSKSYREILKAFGQSGRNPSPSEIKYMDKWLGEYGIELEAVLEACDRTMMNTESRRFQYCDKIITNWFDKGVVTLDDARKVSEEFNEAKARDKDKAKPVRKSAVSKNRFANFEQRDFNFDEIEKAERAYLDARVMK